MTWRSRRSAGGNVDVANPLLYHHMPSVLSVQTVWSARVCKKSAIHAWWSTLPDSSRSLLVNWPSWLPQETSCAVMYMGKLF